jgi:adenylate cyclase
LVKPNRAQPGLAVGLEEGREVTATAMFVDLRDSTRLAAGRLPFDVIFIANSYIQAATAAILGQGGHVTSIAGDGIMSVFGIDGDERGGARAALAAMIEIHRAIDRVNADLTAEIGGPLRYGIGVHTGPSIVGSIGPLERSSLQFLGDTGNVAARLESLTKEFGCSALISIATWEAADRREAVGRRVSVYIRGRGEIAALVFENLTELSESR